MTDARLPSNPTGICVECLRSVPRSEMIEFSGSYVCAECKPVVVHKLQQGQAIGRLWQSGAHLVITPGAEFPNRCVRCNDPTSDFRLKRTVYWHHPSLYFLIPLLPLYIIVVLAVQRRHQFAFPLCRYHLLFRSIPAIVAIGGAFILSLVTGNFPQMFGGVWAMVFILYLAFVLFLMRAFPAISLVRLTSTHIHLKGAGRAFLETLPEWPGPPLAKMSIGRMGTE